MSPMLHIFLAAVAVCAFGCSRGDTEVSLSLPAQRSDPPTTAGSIEPNLHAAPDGRIYLNWVEPDGELHALSFSVWKDGDWSAPKRVASGDHWFVNWADFPSLISLPDGALVAHWLQKSGEGTYDYDVRISRSSDGGDSWSPGVKPYDDPSKSEHGFVSMLPWGDGGVLAVWLDGRNTASHDGQGHDIDTPELAGMTLRLGIMDQDNRRLEEKSLDELVCDCCQTAIARTTRGAVIVYRDRSPAEIRDVYITRVLDNGQQEIPRPIFEDNWQINGCPVNGPAIAANDNRVVVTWFTAAGDIGRVQVAFSDDEGETFGAPITVDDGDPMGRVGVVLLADGSAAVTWMEYAADGADIRLRRLWSDGRKDESYTVAQSSKERASGFPAIVCNGQEIIVAWTEIGDTSHVRAATIELR